MKKTKHIINVLLGETIKRIRKRKNITQTLLARRTNLHRAYIGQIERGEKNIGIVNLKLIADGLAVTLTELLEPIDQQFPDPYSLRSGIFRR